jgi:hypothetical protein
MSAKDPKNGNNAKAGAAKDCKAVPAPGGKANPVLGCEQKHWIGVRVVGEDGKPLAGVKIKLKLTDGTTRDVVSDANGKYVTDKVLPAGSCDISFPDLFDIEWQPN